MKASPAARAQSFGAVADLYDESRPGYPDDLVYWLVGEEPRRVLDLGAGTGKLSAALVRFGHEVVAVEPDPAMRVVLARNLPGVEVLAGQAESLPVPTRSFDAVVVGQAYHWFDRSLAVPEMARVLRPGGALGLAWNVWDSRRGWVRALEALVGQPASSERVMERIPDVDSPWFGPYQRAEFPHGLSLDAAALVRLVSSRSDLITLPADDRAELLAAVAALSGSHPSLAGRDSFELPMVCRAFRSVAFALSPDWEH